MSMESPKAVLDACPEFLDHGVRFQLHDVQPIRKDYQKLRIHEAFRKKLKRRIESCSDYHKQVIEGHPEQSLVVSTYLAFANHQHLVLSPDAVWLTILQGLSHHIHLDPEAYRDLLVDHQGRLMIKVEPKDFVEGSPENPWPELFQALTAAFQSEKSKTFRDWSLAEFSTTGLIERVAFQIAFLDIMEPYHEYAAGFICGIPSVLLKGKAEDWQEIERRAENLSEFGMNEWLESLRPILKEFVKASLGEVNLDHWSQIVNTAETYGSSLITGWIGKLVPYLTNSAGQVRRRNPMLLSTPQESPLWQSMKAVGDDYLTDLFDDEGNIIGEGAVEPVEKIDAHENEVIEDEEEEEPVGIKLSSLPDGLCQVPLRVERMNGTAYKELVAGFVGVAIDEDSQSVEAKMGWAICQQNSLTVALRQLSDRKLLNPRSEDFDNLRDENVPAFLVEIMDSCDGGRIENRKGQVVGRLLSARQLGSVKFQGKKPVIEPFFGVVSEEWRFHDWIHFADLGSFGIAYRYKPLTLAQEFIRFRDVSKWSFRSSKIELKEPFPALLLRIINSPNWTDF